MGVSIERTPDRGPDLRSTVLECHAEALFASTLQASDRPTVDQVRQAVAATLQRLGTVGCAAWLAGEFGDHPELAATRMAWAIATIDSNYRSPDSRRTPLPRALALAG
jgi:hypothetical protein